MRNRTLYSTLLIGFLIVRVISYAQYKSVSNEKECKKLVRSFYAKMNENKKEGHIKYKYSSTIIPRDKRQEIQKSESIIMYGNDKTYFQNDLVDMYQDQKEIFVVMHQTKQIIWSYNASNNTNSIDPFIAQQLVDTLIGMSKVVECLDEKIEGVNYKKITVQIPYEVQNEVQMKAMVFWINPQSTLLKKTKIIYPSYHEVLSLENTFYPLKEKFKMDNKPIKNMVFDSGNKLLDKYKYYTLVDQRN